MSGKVIEANFIGAFIVTTDNNLIIKCNFHIPFYANLSPTETATAFFRWLAVASIFARFLLPSNINLPFYDFCTHRTHLWRGDIGAMPLCIKFKCQVQSVLISHHHHHCIAVYTTKHHSENEQFSFKGILLQTRAKLQVRWASGNELWREFIALSATMKRKRMH